MPLVFDDLRAIARRYFERERPDHTLQPTALVNELYLRFAKRRSVQWEGPSHFFGAAAQMMRRLLVDHARLHRTAKRGSGVVKLPLSDELPVRRHEPEEMLALDEALDRLQAMEPRQAKVMELKSFAGLTNSEIAKTLGAEDPELRREVESLLASDVEAHGLVDEPLVDLHEPPVPKGRRIGPYKVLDEIGRGGLGVVYLAARDDDEFEQKVALKVIKRGMDTDEVVRRFRRERLGTDPSRLAEPQSTLESLATRDDNGGVDVARKKAPPKPAPGDLRIVQDFVNTAATDKSDERLKSPEDLVDLLVKSRLLPQGTPLTEEDLQRALDLRLGLHALLHVHNGGELSEPDVERLDRAAAPASLRVRFEADGHSRFEPSVPGLDGALAQLLILVVEAQRDGRWRRLKACGNPDCRRAFYDGSRSRVSRWCCRRCSSLVHGRLFRRRHDKK